VTSLSAQLPAERIAAEIITNPEDIVFVSGSLVEGFGNENSDLDLFLVRQDGEATPDPRLVLATVGVEGAYVDYEVYNLANMSVVSDHINKVDLSNFRAVWETPLDRIDLYYRTAVAQPVYNAEGLARLQRNFDRDTSARLLQAWAGLRSVIRLQEARESVDAGQEAQALVSAQAAAAYAADSYLPSEGEAYANLKWRYEKIERRFGRDSTLYQRLWALKSPGERDAGAYLEDVGTFCDDMGMGEYAAWKLDSLLLSQARGVKLFSIGSRRVLVQNKTMLFELNAFAVSVWRALHRPLTRPQLVERVIKRAGGKSDKTSAELDALLRAWKRYRLVREA
jgi:hypothetical protein